MQNAKIGQKIHFPKSDGNR